MKKIFSIMLFVFVLSITTDSRSTIIDLLKKQIEYGQANFPIGDLNDVEYVKNIINRMVLIDQEIRQYVIENTNDQEAIKLMEKVDRFNTTKMKEILSIHGWVTISKFGVQTDNQAWTLVQHADDDPFFQAGCVFILGSLIDKGETDKKHYAYLYDRVALKFPTLGMKQKYGTQLNGDLELLPYEGSIETLNVERYKMGLSSIEEYMDLVKKIYNK